MAVMEALVRLTTEGAEEVAHLLLVLTEQAQRAATVVLEQPHQFLAFRLLMQVVGVVQHITGAHPEVAALV